MRIKKFATVNWMGAPDREYTPGNLMCITGRNGAGKSSIIEALKYAIGSGHDPSVIRMGAEEAKVEIATDDGTIIKVRVTEKRTTRDITDKQGRKITRQAEWIRSVVDSLSLDPIALLSATPKAQLEAVLQAAPLRVTAQDLSFVPVAALEDVSLDDHALQVLERVRKHIYDERTGVNRVASEKRKAASAMRKSLPDLGEEVDYASQIAVANRQYGSLELDTQNRIKAIEADAKAATTAATGLFHEKEKSILEERSEAIAQRSSDLAAEISRREAELQAQIAKLKEEHEQGLHRLYADSQLAVDVHTRERDGKLKQIEESRRGALAGVENQFRPQLEQAAARIAELKQAARIHEDAARTRKFIEGQEREAEAAEASAEKLTRSLTQLEDLKKRLGNSLPVPGLEITDDGLTLNGIPFHRVNKAKQIQVALSIAKLQAGELGLIVIDDMEHLDAESFAAFEEAAQLAGLQFIATKVEDHPLEVKNA